MYLLWSTNYKKKMSANEADTQKLRTLVRFVFIGLDYVEWFIRYYRENVRCERVDERDIFVEFVEYAKKIYEMIGKTVLHRVGEEKNLPIYRRSDPMRRGRSLLYSGTFDDATPVFEFSTDTPLTMFGNYSDYGKYANVALSRHLSAGPMVSLPDFESDVEYSEEARDLAAAQTLATMQTKLKDALYKMDGTHLEHVSWCWIVSAMTRMPLIHHLGIAHHIQSRSVDGASYVGLADTSLAFTLAIQAQLNHYDERLNARILHYDPAYLLSLCTSAAKGFQTGANSSAAGTHKQKKDARVSWATTPPVDNSDDGDASTHYAF